MTIRPPAALELALLALLTWPWSRLLLDPRRRLARIGPFVYAGLATVLLAGATVAIVAAQRAPALLQLATAIAVVVAAIAGWRARPGYGRARRLPPGSLALSRSIEAVVERDFYAREWRRHGPIFKMTQFNQPVVCVAGLELAHDLIRRHHPQLGPTPLPYNDDLRGGFLRYMDEATHEVYGALFRVALSSTIVEAAEPALRRTARREWAVLAATAGAGAAGARAGAAPGPALDRIVFAAFARVLFGIEEESPAFAELARDYAVLRAQPLTKPLGERSRAALDRLRALVEDRARRDADGICWCALDQLRRANPAMPDGVCVDNLVFILNNATENVEALLRWLIKTLGEHPQWSDRLRRELSAGPARTTPAPRLADRIVMETLRLAQSEYLYRVVLEDLEYGGFVLPAGWRLRVCVGESHRDPTIWPDAARFDPDRFLGPAEPRTRYSPFGFHQHACNGVDLNNMICRVTLEELAAGFDWSIARDGAVERDFRHWSHWRPSARFAIAISPRAGRRP